MGSLTWLGRSDLPGLVCPYCGRTASPDAEAILAAEQAWGFVGAALTLRGVRTAALLITPVPESRDALLTCLWVAPGFTGRGRGKRLVQAAAAGLVSRDVEAILARGARTRKDCAAPPADFLRAVGFTRTLDERRDAVPRPERIGRADRLWRLDLTTTVTAPRGLRAWGERWLGVLRPVRPEPAGRVSRDS